MWDRNTCALGILWLRKITSLEIKHMKIVAWLVSSRLMQKFRQKKREYEPQSLLLVVALNFTTWQNSTHYSIVKYLSFFVVVRSHFYFCLENSILYPWMCFLFFANVYKKMCTLRIVYSCWKYKQQPRLQSKLCDLPNQKKKVDLYSRFSLLCLDCDLLANKYIILVNLFYSDKNYESCMLSRDITKSHSG